MNNYLLEKGYVFTGQLKNKRETTEKNNTAYVATLLKNIESYGFTLSSEVIDYLMRVPKNVIKDFYIDLVKSIDSNVGRRVDMNKMMYKNFPQEVMDKDSSELYFNQILHYVSCGEIYPHSEQNIIFPLIHETNLKILKGVDDICEMVKGLLSSKADLTIDDLSFIEKIIMQMDYSILIRYVLPKQEDMRKETLIFVINTLKEKGIENVYELKTATDVLRLVAAKCCGDISLNEDTMFKGLSRPYRRYIMDLLSQCDNIEEDMRRHKQQWLRLGEYIKPFTYKQDKYERVYNAFYKLRNNPSELFSFNGYINKAQEENRIEDMVNMLKSRPGDFGRKLLSMVRNNPLNQQYIILSFCDIIDMVPTLTLLSIQKECDKLLKSTENDNMAYRVFMPKANSPKIFMAEDTRKHINFSTIALIIESIHKELINRFSKKENLGNVYIDERLADIAIPTSERNASTGYKSFPRGSRTNIDNKTKILRLFVYWKHPSDIDLSAMSFDKDFNTVDFCSFRNASAKSNIFCHSGDIVDGCNGADEYIDIDLNTIKNTEARYVIMTVNSYSGVDFSEYEEVFCGYMERQNDTGEVFEPCTIESTSRLFGSSTWNMPIVFDIQKNQIIWSDMAVPGYFGGENIVDNRDKVAHILKSVVNLDKPKLGDLFMLHASSRGNIVHDKDKADIIFSLDEGITPFDTDIIMSKFL